MVAEAEKFAEEDEAQKKRIESLNSLSSFVYGLKNQVGDEEGLGGKLADEDNKSLLKIIKDAQEWIDESGGSASVEDLEEKLTGESINFCLSYCFALTSRSRYPSGCESYNL